jgi:sodium transport system permease protein
MRNILTIYLKEMKEVLRDRKSLVFMVLLPALIVPMLMNLMIGFATRLEEKTRTETLAFAVFGSEYLPELADAFTGEKDFEKVDIGAPDAIESAITEKKIKFALVIPEAVQQQIRDGNQVAVRLYYDNASVGSKVPERTGKVIRRVGENWQTARLAALGLDTPRQRQQLLNPITIEEHGIAGTRQVIGAHVGGMLPYLFIILCFAGSLYPAIDIGAGEKERGTLETLLLAPVPRYQIVLGKFLVIFTTGVTAALLNIASIAVILLTKLKELTDIMGEVIKSVSVIDLLLVAAMLIPTAAIFASLLLSVSIYARSFKEASAYCGPLNFLVIIPAFVALLPGVELNWFWALVPITNISLAVKELVKGTMNYYMLSAILGSSFAIAAALLVFCTKWFQREAVLFRE